MHTPIRILIAGAALALFAGCATTGEETDQAEVPADQQGITAQPGQEAYSYGYGQAPGNYDSYDTSGTGAYAGAGRPGAGGSHAGSGGSYAGAGAGYAGGGMNSADRIVYFGFDQYEVLPQSRGVVDTNARYLAGNRQIITQLEGHTDDRGSREYNIALGERRANTVRQMMGAMGVSPQQMRVVSYGKERPAAPGYDEQSHALNRRVEIVY